MTLTNEDLVRRFVQGGDSGKSNRMAIAAFEDWTLLWGYGWALYGARRDDGTLFVYDGWDGYSSTTSSHMTLLTSAATSAYGDSQDDGHSVKAVVDGDGGTVVTKEPPVGHVYIRIDADPGTDYGRLDAPDRPELTDLDDRHVPSPDGASTR